MSRVVEQPNGRQNRELILPTHNHTKILNDDTLAGVGNYCCGYYSLGLIRNLNQARLNYVILMEGGRSKRRLTSPNNPTVAKVADGCQYQ